MKIVIFGPPGSGKGTYASRLSPQLGIPKISTGDIFRRIMKEDTPLGREIKKIYDAGGLQSDELTIKILKEEIKKPEAKKGFILDGFPRTIEQAKSLEKIAKIDVVVNLDVPDWVIIVRLSNRVTCSKCGTIFNLKFLKPKKEGVCDKCGGELVHRKDDDAAVIQDRLDVYRKQTKPLIDYYETKGLVKNVSCDDPGIEPGIVVNQILQVLKGLKSWKG